MFNQIAKVLYFVLLLIFVTQNYSYSLDSITPNPPKYISNNNIEQIFKSNLGNIPSIIYTKVPRGLVISLDSSIFFEKESVELKDSSLELLNKISILISEAGKPCVIEANSTEKDLREDFEKSNLELTIVRAQNIAQYIVNTKLVTLNQIYAIGFGEIMPFRDNVDYREDMDNRIDFVIINYEKYQR